MNKSDLRSFYEEAFWPSMPPDRNKILLILDAWSANKDDQLSSDCVPEGVDFSKTLIPDGCTGFTQPLDVLFFRPHKAFVRFITDNVIDETQFNIWQILGSSIPHALSVQCSTFPEHDQIRLLQVEVPM